ncbi:MAG: CDP-alcohol phosphatidyltransferase family protein [Dehalococcoidales bacterium]|jgi:CDP-diacylglycerol--glycerol-3-phosphate 3-phosphatidyltransferase|nr:CDP-alcohol phosphatidyltransferase family protein [Dehalococcoidales bacterium]NLT28581.1 CDP-alcohol phosphatidyltransferase family protein [Dehalococcoidales bacterium]
MSKMAQVRKRVEKVCTDPVVNLLEKTGITPNTLTWIGFFIALVTAVFAALGNLPVAGLLLLFGGYFDMLDGSLARRTGKVSVFGEVLDSTLDRLSEGAVLIGILYWFTVVGSVWGIMLVGVTMLSSLVVSYIRAKAEIIKVECLKGLFTRPERVIALAVGFFINRLEIAIGIIAFFSMITVGQRLYHVWRQLK